MHTIKANKKFAVFLVIVAILSLFPIAQTKADIILDVVQTAALLVPYVIIWALTAFALILVFLGSFLVDSALNPGIFVGIMNAPVINTGWLVVRDFANLFFLIILLFVAIATILRMQSYAAKTWVPSIILAAVFINFSKVITIFVIDIVNMFMYGAIGWLGNSVEATGIGQLNNVAVMIFNNLAPGTTGWITVTDVVAALAGFTFVIVLAVTLWALALFLIIRMAMLAILIIFSPAAFLLYGWPSDVAQTYSSKWWKALIKYCIMGPIFVFFLFVAAQMADSLFTMGPLVTPTPMPIAGIDTSAFAYIIGISVPYIIVIVMLLASLKITNDLGIFGAGALYTLGKGLTGAAVGYTAYKAFSPLTSKLARGLSSATNWGKGAQDARREGRLRQHMKDTFSKDSLKGFGKARLDDLRQTPRMVIGQTFGGVYKEGKAQVETYKEKQKKQQYDKYKRTNATIDEIQKDMESPFSSPTQIAAAIERIHEKKGSMVNRTTEYELNKRIEDYIADENNNITDKTPVLNYPPELKNWMAQHEKIREQNNQKEVSLAKLASQGGLDKGEFRNARPDLAYVIGGKPASEETKAAAEHIQRMKDEGVSLNKINPESYGKLGTILALQQMFKNDPEKFNYHMETRGKPAQENATKALHELIEIEKRKAIGNTDATRKFFDPAASTEDGRSNNFHNAATLAVLKGRDLSKIFTRPDGETDHDAITKWMQHNPKDIPRFYDKDDKQLIAKNITADVVDQLQRRDTTPAQRKELVVNVLNNYMKESDPTKKTVLRDALKSINSKEIWYSTLGPDDIHEGLNKKYLDLLHEHTKDSKPKKNNNRSKQTTLEGETVEEEEENEM